MIVLLLLRSIDDDIIITFITFIYNYEYILIII